MIFACYTYFVFDSSLQIEETLVQHAAPLEGNSLHALAFGSIFKLIASDFPVGVCRRNPLNVHLQLAIIVDGVAKREVNERGKIDKKKALNESTYLMNTVGLFGTPPGVSTTIGLDRSPSPLRVMAAT